MNPYTISREDLLKELSVSPERGLSTQEAQERLAKYGENKLTEKKKKRTFSGSSTSSKTP